jgi:hypothetical protein
MPSPHQVIAALLAKIWPSAHRHGVLYRLRHSRRLNATGHTISIMGEQDRRSDTPVDGQPRDPPKTFGVDRSSGDAYDV